LVGILKDFKDGALWGKEVVKVRSKEGRADQRVHGLEACGPRLGMMEGGGTRRSLPRGPRRRVPIKGITVIVQGRVCAKSLHDT